MPPTRIIKLSNPPLIVEVIGATHFYGVPDNLQPTNSTRVKTHNQDQGSDAARLIECAGRTCYDSYGQGRSSAEYHDHIEEVGHGSVTEHASINFYIANVSRGLTHELVRHRAGVAISQRSTRYVQESESPWIHHPLVLAYLNDVPESPLAQEIEDTVLICRSLYDRVAVQLEAWQKSKGVDAGTARKQARGAARGYLGNALSTALVWTANVRALRHCMEQRASDTADAEICQLFKPIYDKAYAWCPEYFQRYVWAPRRDGLGEAATSRQRKL